MGRSRTGRSGSFGPKRKYNQLLRIESSWADRPSTPVEPTSHGREHSPAVRTDVDAILPLLLELAENGFQVDVRYRLRGHRGPCFGAHVLRIVVRPVPPFPPCWVAEREGAVVGMVSGEPLQVHAVLEQPPTARISDLWVEPAFRRQGVARQLVQTFREAAVEAGYLRLEVSTLARDARALAFWRSMGFEDLLDRPVAGRRDAGVALAKVSSGRSRAYLVVRPVSARAGGT